LGIPAFPSIVPKEKLTCVKAVPMTLTTPATFRSDLTPANVRCLSIATNRVSLHPTGHASALAVGFSAMPLGWS
jgi:hypothetical protein